MVCPYCGKELTPDPIKAYYSCLSCWKSWAKKRLIELLGSPERLDGH